ncbi:MAG: DUF4160 domain-containing protein, partial [Bacteroides sp.]|nr:DUF4160 domain-containing protein [Bacteroides sp.]
VLLSTGGASIEVAGPAAVAGLQVAGGSAVVGAAGLYMAANAASNQSGGYERGGNSSGRSGKIIVKKGDVSVSSYGTGDVHKPAHAHVKGGGKEVRIGLKGHPLKGEPDLSKRQKEVVKEHQKEIRKEINKVGRLNKRLENENR